MKLVKILAVTALLVAGAAQAAGYTTFEYHDETKRSDDSGSNKFGLVVGTKTEGGQDYSIKLDMAQAEWGNGSISNGVEVRARQGFKVAGVSPYVGVRLGQKLKSDESFSHYAFDGGVKFPIVGVLSGDVGMRYRNAFDTVNAAESTRYHAMVSYAIDKSNSIGIRYSQSFGDINEEKNAYRLTYTHSF